MSNGICGRTFQLNRFDGIFNKRLNFNFGLIILGYFISMFYQEIISLTIINLTDGPDIQIDSFLFRFSEYPRRYFSGGYLPLLAKR